MITLDNLFTFFEFIAEENTYIQHQPGTTGTTNRFSRFSTETTTGQLSKLGYPRLEVVQLPFGLITDFNSSQQETLTARVRVIYKLSDKFDFDEEVTALDNAKKALFQMLNYIQTAQDECPGNSLLCAFDMSTVRYTWLDKATFSGSAVGCELSINFKKGICWEEVAYGDFPEYNGTIALPTTAGSYVLRLLNGVYSWVTASASATWGSITGTLSEQTDLNTALSNKANASDLTAHTSNTSNPHSVTATQVDALKRDGSNANSDIDLGAYKLNAQSLGVKGVNGAGHVGLKHQASNATASANETSLFAGSDGELYYKNDGNSVVQIATRAWVTAQGYITNVITALGYTPENVANKTTTIAGNESSTTLYANVKGLVDWVKQGMTALLSASGLTKTTPVDADSLLLNDSADSNKLKLLSWANLKATLKTYFDTLYTSVQKAYLSSGDATLTSSTTPTNITGLSFSLEANSRYEISGQLFIGSGNSSGGQWGATIPTGASMRIVAFGMQNTASVFKREVISTSGVLVGNYPAAFTTAGFLWLTGSIETGANAGTFQVQFACTSAPGYTITCYKLGTALTLIKL